MPKGNEELKAKIAKIQQKSKSAPAMPVPEPEAEPAEDNMEALEAEFEAKKKALMQKKASPAKSPEPQEEEADDAGIEKAIEEYADDAKFRVEIVFQLVQLNKSFKEIADSLKALTNNDGD